MDKTLERRPTDSKQNKIINTLNCKLFGEDHIVILYKYRRKTSFYIYLNKSGEQDIYSGTLLNKKRIQKALEYLEDSLL